MKTHYKTHLKNLVKEETNSNSVDMINSPTNSRGGKNCFTTNITAGHSDVENMVNLSKNKNVVDNININITSAADAVNEQVTKDVSYKINPDCSFVNAVNNAKNNLSFNNFNNIVTGANLNYIDNYGAGLFNNNYCQINPDALILLQQLQNYNMFINYNFAIQNLISNNANVNLNNYS
jgi:hypothetical protein